MVTAIPGGNLLRVVTNDQMLAAEEADAAARVAAENPEPDYSGLVGFLTTQYEIMRNHRDSASGWSGRLLESLRAFTGQYSPDQLREIERFGGSKVYARVTAIKARGAASLLRDVYLGSEKSWGLDPNPDPEVPPEIHDAIQQLIQSELANAQMNGQPVPPPAIRDRMAQLLEAARQAAKKKAGSQAQIAEDKLEEILMEGNFYKALAEFITDLTIFPYAIIKGPVVRIVPQVTWEGGAANTKNTPKLF
jgi:hypothetical protein